MPAPHHAIFYRPDAVPDSRPTVSKHRSVRYDVWGMMQQRVYQISVQDVDKLHQRFVETWTECHGQHNMDKRAAKSPGNVRAFHAGRLESCRLARV